MGYIKKLKNNELVGGTDKTTIYPVTSTEAIFEEITNGNESSFKIQKTINKEQQDELDDHEERIQAAEAEDIKSITINGSTKEFRVDDKNNVDLTIYTVDNDPEMPSIASNVEDLRNMVGTSTPVLETSHKTRIETLEGGESITGSVENKIKTKVDSINSSYQDDNNEYVKYSMTQTSGEVTNFNIDETGLKNAITSLNTSISGDNIVIRSGSTPSGTGEAGKIYRYVNSSNNTYTDYMYSGSSWIALATHDTSDEQAQVAYYTCTATGSGAQATKQFVGNGSLTYTPSSGGHIKILMGETNTATGTIYLQYNTDSTNTKKPLYYNGEPVSTENTWEAGETIAVYYDPSANSNAGAYFASNAQGGGGKAEKIKYDNSQSGLAATDVQGGIDEIQGNSTIIEILNPEEQTQGTYRLTSELKWTTNTSESHYFIPCSPGDIFRITGNENRNSPYVFTTNYVVQSGATVYPSSEHSTFPYVSPNETRLIVAPNDAVGLIISHIIVPTGGGTTDGTPALIEKITYVKPKELQPRVDGLEEDTDAFKWVDVDTSEYVPRRAISSTTWANTYVSIFIPVIEGEEYRITANSSNNAIIDMLSSDEFTIGEEVTTRIGERSTIAPSSFNEITVPEGATFMNVRVYRVSDNVYYAPISIEKKETTKDFVDGVIETEESNAELRSGFNYVWSNVAGTQMTFTNKGTYINSSGVVTSDSNKAYLVYRFPVTGGETVYITGYAGSPATNYTHALAVVHATAERDDPAILDTDGAVRLDTIWKVQKTGRVFERFKIKVPSDANYLFVGGHSTSCPQPLVERRTLALSDSMMESLAELMGVRKKITVGAWNIGHWVQGHIEGMEEDTEGKERIVRKMVNDGHPDILGLTEYSASSSKFATSNAKTFRFYDAVMTKGATGTYCHNAIANNFGVYNVENKAFPCSSTLDHTGTNLDPTDYTYVQGYFKLGNTVVKIIVAHFFFGGNPENNPDGKAAQVLQAEDIVNACSDDEYVIVVGDFNITGSGVDDVFIGDGYTTANHENIGDIITWVGDDGTGARALDNIYAKGFRMSNIRVIPLYRSGSYDGHTCAVSDHQMIVCDLEMK